MKYYSRLLLKRYITDLFIKEDFRQFAISNNIAKHCVIDVNDYCRASEIVGCFKTNEKWIVYETKRDGTKKDEIVFANAKDAFCAVARKFNIDFRPKNFYSISFKKKALLSYKRVSMDLKNTPSGDLALFNAKLIKCDIIQSSSSRRVLSSLPILPAENIPIFEFFNSSFSIPCVRVMQRERHNSLKTNKNKRAQIKIIK